MYIHVLSGDSLSKPFLETGIDGELFICRECLIDGDVNADGLEAFWEMRKQYLGSAYPHSDVDYDAQVQDEYIRLWNIADGNEVILWFESEAFCQVNLWFSIWMIRNTDARFTIAYPKRDEGDSVFKNWSELTENELKESFEQRVKLNHDDVYLAVQLWEAFQKGDSETLAKLAETKSDSFPTLETVGKALSEIKTRPKKVVAKLYEEGHTEFGDLFREFCKSEPVYGFGDAQVKKLYDEVVAKS